MTRPQTRALIVLAVLALAALGGGAWWLTHLKPPAHYVTATVDRGDVTTAITASGTINPVVTVQVGAFVSGVIKTINCDYNTRVRQGQLCATIDPRPYQAIVDQDVANLAVARAQLVKDRTNQVYTALAAHRASLLLGQDSGSRDAADVARNADDQAKALIALDEAAIADRQAILAAARINLNYTNIVSPVDGTVVSRNVNAGQTVAASFQTPTLFLIARDLTAMQVDTNVSESDIAGAVQGADATFTVDAFPERTFHGKVTQVRQAPISVQNVITYDVVITVANPELLLKPGMTATTRIVRAAAHDVVRVPSQAARFTPTGQARTPGRSRAVWLLRDGKPVRAEVKVGLDDDSFVQIASGEVKAGDTVIVSQAAAKPAKGGGGPATATPSMRPGAAP